MVTPPNFIQRGISEQGPNPGGGLGLGGALRTIGDIGISISSNELEKQKRRRIVTDVNRGLLEFEKSMFEIEQEMDDSDLRGPEYFDQYQEKVFQAKENILQGTYEDRAREDLERRIGLESVNHLRRVHRLAQAKETRYQISSMENAFQEYKNLYVQSENFEDRQRFIIEAESYYREYGEAVGMDDNAIDTSVNQELDKIRSAGFERDLQNDPIQTKEDFEKGLYGFSNEELNTAAKNDLNANIDKLQAENYQNAYVDMSLDRENANNIAESYKGKIGDLNYKRALVYANHLQEQIKAEREAEIEEQKIYDNNVLQFNLLLRASRGEITIDEIIEKDYFKDFKSTWLFSLLKDEGVSVEDKKKIAGILDRVYKGKATQNEIDKLFELYEPTTVAGWLRQAENAKSQFQIGEYNLKASRGEFTESDYKKSLVDGVLSGAGASSLLIHSNNIKLNQEVEKQQLTALDQYYRKFELGIATEEDVNYLTSEEGGRIFTHDKARAEKERIKYHQEKMAEERAELQELSFLKMHGGMLDPKDERTLKLADIEVAANPSIQNIVDTSVRYGVIPTLGRRLIRAGNAANPDAIYGSNIPKEEQADLIKSQTESIISAVDLYDKLPPIARSQIPPSESENILPIYNLVKSGYRFTMDQEGNTIDRINEIISQVHDRKTQEEFSFDAKKNFLSLGIHKDEFISTLDDHISQGGFFSKDKYIEEAIPIAYQMARELFLNNKTWSWEDSTLKAYDTVTRFAGTTNADNAGKRSAMYSPEILYKNTSRQIYRRLVSDINQAFPETKGVDLKLVGENSISNPFINSPPEFFVHWDPNNDGVFEQLKSANNRPVKFFMEVPKSAR